MSNLAVIFDFDGVIANTEPSHLSATEHALDARGVALSVDEYTALYLGYTDRGLFEALARDRSLAWSPADVDALVEAKGRAFDAMITRGSVTYPSAKRCIERLATARIPLAIASGAFAHEIDAILNAARLRSHFHAIVGAGDYAAGKPEPDPYREAARRLGMPAARCVAIEDSRWGLDSARAAGCGTIAVTHTYPRGALTATAIVESLDEVTLDLIRAVVPSPA